jgi:hypothetical protein
MVGSNGLSGQCAKLICLGCWRVGTGENHFYQYPLLDDNQELRRSQEAPRQTGRQNSRNRDYQGRARGEILQRYILVYAGVLSGKC